MIFEFFLANVISAQRTFLLTNSSAETFPQDASKGCARLSTPDIKKFVFDFAIGSVFGWTDEIHRCGEVQCPACFLIEDTITSDIDLFLRSCHSTTRLPTQEKRISVSSLCGYRDGLREEEYVECAKCQSRDANTFCQKCDELTVKCFEDCDHLLQTRACQSHNSHPDCQYCTAFHRDTPRSRAQHPTEGGRQFFYASGDRVVEFMFINNSTHLVNVGTGPDRLYPGQTELSDMQVIPPGATLTAACFEGRFFWQ